MYDVHIQCVIRIDLYQSSGRLSLVTVYGYVCVCVWPFVDVCIIKVYKMYGVNMYACECVRSCCVCIRLWYVLAMFFNVNTNLYSHMRILYCTCTRSTSLTCSILICVPHYKARSLFFIRKLKNYNPLILFTFSSLKCDCLEEKYGK